MLSAANKYLIHKETHLTHRAGWLRAAVLGANDGILSIASIISGMSAGGAGHGAIMLAGLAGLVAGATSMAAGEYVSVSSQSDIENADVAREKIELVTAPKFEQEELAQIYVTRGLEPDFAREVSQKLMAHDALGAHMRDELGISDTLAAQPLQAAFSSAASFTVGAALPMFVTALTSARYLELVLIPSSIVFLAALGVVAAQVGGANIFKSTLRVVVWGVISMGVTAAIGLVSRSYL